MPKNIFNKLYALVPFLLSTLFPQPIHIEQLEGMTAREFAQRASLPLEQPPHSIYTLFKYKDRFVRQALWEVKYNGNQIIAKLFATLVYEQIIEVLAEEELFSNFIDPVIIPLPLSKERFKERGWNQAEMIAKEVVKLNKDFTLNTTALQKVKHTLPQTKLSKSQRLKNLKGCFAIKNSETEKANIRNRNIILIDDVTTTGSTILEAKKVLVNAGARKVLAFTIAH